MLLFVFLFLNCISELKYQNTNKNEVFLGLLWSAGVITQKGRVDDMQLPRCRNTRPMVPASGRAACVALCALLMEHLVY